MTTKEGTTPMKDRSFYMNVGGRVVRVRASKPPDNETTEALTALVKAVINKSLMKKITENHYGDVCGKCGGVIEVNNGLYCPKCEPYRRN